MEPRTDLIKQRAAQAAGDLRLHHNLTEMALRFSEMRTRGQDLLGDYQALREQGRAVKDWCLANLSGLLEQLAERVAALGGQVHWAPTAADARRLILDIARRHGVKSVVKGKSMMTEEIGLNAALEAEGITARETDLGEFIIQLAHQGPSHILAPAIHLNRREIGRLLAETLGVPFTDNPEKLTMVARRALREQFFAADMGITGGNFAIAQSGTLALFENEGNIRYSTTLPGVHLALIGLEKVVADWRQFDILRRLLTYTGTGQKAPGYLSLISGPRRAGEWDGPREFHLVLLDNGRSRILAEPALRQSLRCLRCGACLNVCPAYLWMGGHSYGWVYSGPIGSILNSLLLEPEQVRDQPRACTGCGACAEVCPVMIDHPDLMLHLRWLLAEDPAWQAGAPPADRRSAALYTWLARRPGAWRAAGAAARGLQPLADLGRGALLPRPLAHWVKSRGRPRLRRPFSRRWPALKRRLFRMRPR